VTKPKRSRPFIRLVTGAIVAFQSLSATAASASSSAALNVDETGHIVVMEYESLYGPQAEIGMGYVCGFYAISGIGVPTLVTDIGRRIFIELMNEQEDRIQLRGRRSLTHKAEDASGLGGNATRKVWRLGCSGASWCDSHGTLTTPVGPSI